MGASPIHWVSFLGYHFNFLIWDLGCKMWTGKCSLVKGVTKQPLLLLSSMLSREKQATPRFLRAAGLKVMQFIYKIKSCVVALFSVKPMNSVNLMSVKVMHDCTVFFYVAHLTFLLLSHKLNV